MAYRKAVQISPQDLESGYKAIGVQLPFSSPSAFISTYQTVDSYRSNLLNYFLTSKGDRYLNPGFGNELPKYLFEFASDTARLSTIKQTILRELSVYFPRIVVDSLDLDVYAEQHTLQVRLVYHILNTPTTDEIVINFE